MQVRRNEDLVGREFGRLKVISFHEKIGKQRYWLCQCKCGETVIHTTARLKSGHTQSCGCLGAETRGKRGRKENYDGTTFPEVYRAYKNQAANRSMSFELSSDDVKQITSENCFYCGAQPSNIYKGAGNRTSYVYNGIDRKDNTKGYTKENVVTCCYVCNRAKMGMTEDEWNLYLSQLVNYRSSK